MGTLYCIQCGEAFESDDPASVFCPEHGGKAQEDLFQTMPKQEPLPKTPEGTRIRRQEPMQHEPSGYHGKSFSTFAKGDILADLYRIDDIKAGGMGYVYIAKHQQWGVKLAIKSPNELMLSDPAFFSMILKEADAWTELGLHPNIAYCYYIRQFDGIPLIFIEYVDGGNLRDWIAEARCYDLKTGLDLAIQFCHGLEHAHKQGKIHRDIKPENILMTTNGTLKITDFGLIKGGGIAHGGRVGRGGTSFGTIMGTLAYMSPEQYEDASAIDERTDIYAFGVCLYEMFCGRLPYAQTSDQVAASYLARLDNRPAPEPAALRPDLPEVLAVILKRCIALDRAHRYPHLADLRQDLAAVYRQMYLEDAPHAELAQVDLRADALNNRAVSYLDLGREDDAIACWQEALTIDPQHFEATYNYNYLLFENGRLLWDGFKARLESLEVSIGQRSEYWKTVAWQYLAMGDMEKIEEIQKSSNRQFDTEFLAGVAQEAKRLTRIGPNYVRTAAITPNGRHALLGIGSHLLLWELSSGKEIMTYTGHTEAVESAAVTQDSRYALSGSKDTTLKLWDLNSGQHIRTFIGHTSPVSALSITPNCQFVVSGSNDSTLKLWDIATGQELRTYIGHSSPITAIAITPDGKHILSGSQDNSLKLWNVNTGQEIQTFTGHTRPVSSVAITPDGRLALSGSLGTTRCWNLATGKEIEIIGWHRSGTAAIAITPDGRKVLSGGLDGWLILWDLITSREIRSFRGPSGIMSSLSITPDGKHALSGSYDSVSILLDISETKFKPLYPLISAITAASSMLSRNTNFRIMIEQAQTLIERGLFPEAIHILRKAQQVPGFESDPEILDSLHAIRMKTVNNIIKLSKGWPRSTLKGHSHIVSSVAITPDSKYILSGSWDETLKLWDVLTGKEVRTFTGHTGWISAVAITPDGHHALSGSYDGTIKFWQLETGQEIHCFKGHDDFAITSLTISPDGRYILSGDNKNTLIVRKLDTGQIIKVMSGNDSFGITSVAIAPNGQFALVGSNDNEIKIWDMVSGKEMRSFRGHTDSIESLVVTPNGKEVLSGGKDNTVILWNLTTGQEVTTISDAFPITSIAVTPDSRFALLGGYSMTLWDIGSGLEIGNFNEQSGKVMALAVSSDGRYAVSGNLNQTITIWEFDWDFEITKN